MLHAHLFDSTDFALAFAVFATCLCFALEPMGICGLVGSGEGAGEPWNEREVTPTLAT